VRHVARLLFGASFLTACGLVTGLNSLERAGAESEAKDAGDAPSESSADSKTDVTPNPCPVDSGVAFVRAGSFCIDSTEVTNEAYALFLTTHTPMNTAQPAACAWNSSFTPKSGWPASEPKFPVYYVTWCDAYAYCASVGKRMCGKIGGGGVDVSQLTTAATDQWYAACSHAGDGLHGYPYGNAFDAVACNGGTTADASAPIARVASFAGCVGGYPNVFDMSGNVREWEDSCLADAGAVDNCRVRGNAADDTDVSCGVDRFWPRGYASAHTGFRCCSAP
jgi:sulfatase modifying factor 1